MSDTHTHTHTLPPHKVGYEISEMLIISESIPNGFNVSIDRNVSLNTAFPPRNHLELTVDFAVTLFFYIIVIVIPFFAQMASGFALC